MNTARAIKIGMAWTTIAWTVCYLAVGLIPGLGSAMVRDLAHMNTGPVERIFTIGNFIAGLIFLEHHRCRRDRTRGTSQLLHQRLVKQPGRLPAESCAERNDDQSSACRIVTGQSRGRAVLRSASRY